jgi:hypothetical protein
MDRRRWCIAALAALSGCGGVPVRREPGQAPGLLPPLIDGLRGWVPHVMRRDRAATVYTFGERDGRRAVHALADRSSSGLRCDVDIDPLAMPWLSWEWRVDQLPDAASASRRDRRPRPCLSTAIPRPWACATACSARWWNSSPAPRCRSPR